MNERRAAVRLRHPKEERERPREGEGGRESVTGVRHLAAQMRYSGCPGALLHGVCRWQHWTLVFLISFCTGWTAVIKGYTFLKIYIFFFEGPSRTLWLIALLILASCRAALLCFYISLPHVMRVHPCVGDLVCIHECMRCSRALMNAYRKLGVLGARACARVHTCFCLIDAVQCWRSAPLKLDKSSLSAVSALYVTSKTPGCCGWFKADLQTAI